jgi:hypothetical protein
MNAGGAMTADPAALAEELAIRALVAQWAFSRDQGAWDDLLACYHDDGAMSVSWFDGPAAEFVERSRILAAARGAGDWSKHFLGVTRVHRVGARALAETDAVILTRGAIGGIAADTTTYSRFFDRIERRRGAWRILHRTAVYERDRIDPVTPDPKWPAVFATLDFSGLPEGCKHLGAALRKRGRTLLPNLVMANSEEERALKSAGRAWMEGGERA